MSEPFIGEIRLMSFNFPPKGWAQCNGQLLAINQNQPLYSLLGTIYGGDGRVNFALPDLRGRVPLHFDLQHAQGERLGTESYALTANEVPPHVHTMMASSANGDNATPTMLAAAANTYASTPANLVQIGAAPPQGPSIGPAGNQPHENMMPYAVVEFCIALQGIFPSPN